MPRKKRKSDRNLLGIHPSVLPLAKRKEGKGAPPFLKRTLTRGAKGRGTRDVSVWKGGRRFEQQSLFFPFRIPYLNVPVHNTVYEGASTFEALHLLIVRMMGMERHVSVVPHRGKIVLGKGHDIVLEALKTVEVVEAHPVQTLLTFVFVKPAEHIYVAAIDRLAKTVELYDTAFFAEEPAGLARAFQRVWEETGYSLVVNASRLQYIHRAGYCSLYSLYIVAWRSLLLRHEMRNKVYYNPIPFFTGLEERINERYKEVAKLRTENITFHEIKEHQLSDFYACASYIYGIAADLLGKREQYSKVQEYFHRSGEIVREEGILEGMIEDYKRCRPHSHIERCKDVCGEIACLEMWKKMLLDQSFGNRLLCPRVGTYKVEEARQTLASLHMIQKEVQGLSRRKHREAVQNFLRRIEKEKERMQEELNRVRGLMTALSSGEGEDEDGDEDCVESIVLIAQCLKIARAKAAVRGRERGPVNRAHSVDLLEPPQPLKLTSFDLEMVRQIPTLSIPFPLGVQQKEWLPDLLHTSVTRNKDLAVPTPQDEKAVTGTAIYNVDEDEDEEEEDEMY